MKYRSSILQVTIAFLCALSLESQAAVIPVPDSIEPQKIAGAKPRNVVFILSDDHRYDAMSFMGHQYAMNPPRGNQQNKRLRGNGYYGRSGEQAADFPEAMVVEQPLRKVLK